MPLYLLIIFICAVVGILDTIYLSYHVIQKTPQTCKFFPQEWCEKVQNSPQSRTFGVPNAFAGFIMYTTILVLAIVFFNGLMPFWPIVVVITVGFMFSLYFTYVQAFVLKAFCTWCVLSAINFVMLFVSVWLLR